MRFPIVYRGQDAGWIDVDADARGMLFVAECPVHTLAVLRLYGLTAQEPLLIGVLEPEDGRLRLRRRITPETLRRAEVKQPPETYYLEDGRPGCSPVRNGEPCSEHPKAEETIQGEAAGTGDTLLDRLIASGNAAFTADEDDWAVRTAFVAGRANPMSFALTACTLEWEDGQAVAVLRGGKNPVCRGK